MYIHENRKLVYLAHAKTASRAVREALGERGFVRSVYAPKSRPVRCGSDRGPNHHKGLREHPGPEWLVFTTVRNHFDAWASWWAYTSRDQTGTEPLDVAFVERIMEKQKRHFPDPNKMWACHTEFADRVLRYESQPADLSNLLGEQVVLPVVGVSECRRGRHYRELISPELRGYIEGRFGDEMAAYGYDW